MRRDDAQIDEGALVVEAVATEGALDGLAPIDRPIADLSKGSARLFGCVGPRALDGALGAQAGSDGELEVPPLDVDVKSEFEARPSASLYWSSKKG